MLPAGEMGATCYKCCPGLCLCLLSRQAAALQNHPFLKMPTKVLLKALAMLPVVLAGVIEYPEVRPGPGLPSLESLGLTSEQLYNMPPPLTLDTKFSPFFNPVCGPDDKAYTSVKSLIACMNYLQNLRTQDCVVPSGRVSVRFCSSGDAHINGVSITGRSESSHCQDVAKGALYVIDHCTRPDESCAGAAAAFGNGNLIVSCCSKKWA